MAVTDIHERELDGLDALEFDDNVDPRAGRLWAALWPKLAAIALALGIWQLVVWTGWKPEYVLPGPAQVIPNIFDNFSTYVDAAAVTLQRAFVGYAIAVAIGTVLGALIARNRVLRTAIASMVTGLMTMPSIAWFPAAIVLLGFSEGAIRFVIVIGAAPSIANGFITGVDNTPPILMRAARVLGAKGAGDRRFRVVGAAPRENGHAPGGDPDRGFDDEGVLFGAQRRPLAGRSARHEAVNAAGDLPGDETLERA